MTDFTNLHCRSRLLDLLVIMEESFLVAWLGQRDKFYTVEKESCVRKPARSKIEVARTG